MKTERDYEEGLDRVGEDGYGSDDSGEFFMIFGKTSAYMKVDATVRPMMWHMSDGEEEYLTEPMELYSVERDAEYMTVPVHEEADSGDIDFDVEEETDQGQRGRKEDGVGLCDDKLRGKRLEAYTEWRFRHGEEGVVCEDDLYGGGSAGEENDDEDVKVYALKVTTEEIEIAKGEQEESGPGHESEIQSPVRIGRVLDVRWIYGLEHEKLYITTAGDRAQTRNK